MKRVVTDQAVVGAGPVGALVAVALANTGRAVTLLEEDPAFGCHFAGEWLHPRGVQLLEKYGIRLEETSRDDVSSGKGFAVFPDDGSEPILLEDAGHREGLAFERSALMEILRKHCEDHPGIQYVPFAKVLRAEGGRLEGRGGALGEEWELQAQRIVGADGRKSLVRRAQCRERGTRLISYMVGVKLKDVDLPFEGFGHVILGGPGPVLIYRIGRDSVRLCFDVPEELFRKCHADGIQPHLEKIPRELRALVRAELAANRYAVRPNQFRPRVYYGSAGMPLIGDAVGFQHPLTAMGMTLGFEDADCLVRSRDFQTFERERVSRTIVPELLALALYEAFSRKDAGAASVRRAIYRMWRSYSVERERTMKLLCGEETNLFRFGQSFLRGAQLALFHSFLAGDSLMGTSREVFGTMGSIGKILCLLSKPSTSRILPLGHVLAAGMLGPATAGAD